jgi:hypothetical protein
MKPDYLLTCSQEHFTNPYPKPTEFSLQTHPPLTASWFIATLPAHVCPGLFPSGFQTYIL